MRSFYKLINDRCFKFRENVPYLAVDEAMIPYFGKNNSKQRIQNKPVRVGYKMWVLAEESGYIVQFDPYQGEKQNGPQRSKPHSWGLGEMTVLELVENLPKDISYHIFIDNFFTSVRLMKFLGNKNIKASGTLKQIGLPKIVLLQDGHSWIKPDEVMWNSRQLQITLQLLWGGKIIK